MQNPPIYIINLARTPERRLYMQRQLDAFSLKYSFVEGIDKHDLCSKKNRAQIAKQVDIESSCLETIYKKCRDTGTVACLLSHLKVYNLMIKNSIDIACVLEDDGYLLPTFPKVLAASHKVPWDIFMLSSHSGIVSHICKVFLAEKHKVLGPLIGYYKLLRYKRYWPQLNPYTICQIALKAPKHVFLKYLQTTRQRLYKRNRRPRIAARSATTFAVEIGALPIHDKSTWDKITALHYAAKPYIGQLGRTPINIISCMAYMLKLSAAHSWKQAVIRLSKESEKMSKYAIPGFASKNLEIDHIPRYLYCRGEAELYILVSPCIRAEPKYMTYSSRRS